MRKKVYIAGSGCTRRLLEVSKIQYYLDVNNYKIVCAPKQADYIILTTCAYDKKEEDSSVAAIKHYKKYKAELLIFGCLSGISPSKLEGLRFLAPKDLDKIDSFFDGITIKYSEIPALNQFVTYRNASFMRTLFFKMSSGEMFTKEFSSRAMGYIKNRAINLFNKTNNTYYLVICRGCLGKCSYCAIKRSVGTVVSEPAANILENFRRGYLEGYKKFTILGDDSGCYGIDINTDLPTLLSAIVEEYQKLRAEHRSKNGKPHEIGLHLNEIHPKFLLKYQADIISICETGVIKTILCPIQSGNDRILQLMQREHKAQELGDCLKKIRRIAPHIHLSTQVIVGFPGETQAEFQDTLDLIPEVGFNQVVFFPYHKKEQTVAARLKDHIPERVIHQRLRHGVKYLRRQGINVYTKCIL
jgi:tRNA A37 methylthiotransferase MiaB